MAARWLVTLILRTGLDSSRIHSYNALRIHIPREKAFRGRGRCHPCSARDQSSRDRCPWCWLGFHSPRSEEGLVDDVGVAAIVGGNGDAAGVKNVKRGIIGDFGAGVVAIGDGNGTGVKNAKRDVDCGTCDGGSGDGGSGDGGSRGKKSGGLTGDIGVGVIALGDGDTTGVKNAKRGVIGDVGVAAVVACNYDTTGVKDTKRSQEGLVGDVGGGSLLSVTVMPPVSRTLSVMILRPTRTLTSLLPARRLSPPPLSRPLRLFSPRVSRLRIPRRTRMPTLPTRRRRRT